MIALRADGPDDEVTLRQVWRVAFAVACAQAVLGAVGWRFLFGDGPHLLLEAARTGLPTVPDPGRAAASWLAQAPMLAARAWGVRDLHALAWIYSVTLQLRWPLSLAATRWLDPGHRVTGWASLSFALFGMASLFQASHEAGLAHALLWPVVAFVASGEAAPRGIGRPIVALACAAGVTATYPGAFLLTLPLTFVAGRASFREPARSRRALLALVAAALAAATAIALWYTLRPSDDGSRLSAWTSAGTLLDRGNVWLCVAPLALLALLAGPARWLRIPVVAILVVRVGAQIAPGDLAPLDHHYGRVLDVIGPLAVLGFAWVVASLRLRGARIEAKGLRLVVLAALAAQCAWLLAAHVQFARFVSTMKSELSKGAGAVAWQTTALDAPEFYEWTWAWTAPTMSILLQGSGDVRAIVLNPDAGRWQPFDPLDPRQLPALGEVGVSYDGYLAWLEGRAKDTSGRAPGWAFREGWYPVEYDEEGRDFHWLDARATLDALRPRQGCLEFEARSADAAGALACIEQPDRERACLRVAPVWTWIRVPTGSRELEPIVFMAEEGRRRPPGDSRSLGIAVARLHWAPATLCGDRPTLSSLPAMAPPSRARAATRIGPAQRLLETIAHRVGAQWR